MLDFPARSIRTSDFPAMWWVAMSRPQYEERLAEEIRIAGAEAFLPREEVVRTHEDRHGHIHRTRSTRPIFPAYVFYSGDRSAAFESAATLKVLNTTAQDCLDIENLKLAYAAGPVRRARVRGIEVGIAVKVVSGAFMGTEGIVERFGDTRVYLRVGTMGGAEIDTDLCNIEPFWGD